MDIIRILGCTSQVIFKLAFLYQISEFGCQSHLIYFFIVSMGLNLAVTVISSLEIKYDSQWLKRYSESTPHNVARQFEVDQIP